MRSPTSLWFRLNSTYLKLPVHTLKYELVVTGRSIILAGHHTGAVPKPDVQNVFTQSVIPAADTQNMQHTKK